ncbi:TcaA NTF2-like domain-containing protein [Niallia sp. Krafla_26]|uniref:TcaA NTF2-like domain-containing protein n=1 Tax=Niallia sp. Krafla_26 TaxID=3064703 RepID=UPI003D164D0E
MNIEGYELIRELFSNRNGLTVYVAKNQENAQLCILRIADVSKSRGEFSLDDWYEVYTDYQQKVTNYKYLPQVSNITMMDPTTVYTTLDCEEGATLREEGVLRLEAISNLIDALQHLQKKGLSHGSIHAGNIWLTKQGKAVLFGAGEASVFEKTTPSSDVSQLVEVIKTYSVLADEDIEKMDLNKPVTLDELRELLTGATENVEKQPKKAKPGLVEQESEEETASKQVAPPDPVLSSTTTNTDSPKDTENLFQKREEETVRPIENEQQRYDQNQHKHSRFKWIIGGIVGVVAIIGAVVITGIIYIGNVMDEKDEPSSGTASVNTTIEEEPEPASVEEETQPQPEEPVVIPVSFTRGEIEEFIYSYGMASVEAVNSRDFSRVEPLLDPNGKSYDSQRDYINYLEEKNITEKFVNLRLNDSQKMNDTTYKISTQEEYEIYYNDGSAVYKKFNSAYHLTVSEDGRLFVNELLYTDETYSELIRAAVTEEYTYESDPTNNLSNYNNYVAPPGDETGAIESAIRLHYGSISNNDFSTAYNVFSKNRRSKVTQSGWEKGLQQNLYDELTRIEVEQIDGSNGVAYIEFTSYDDNSDGTILVQEWAGYWHLIKEGGSWTLDTPDLSKVNSWVEVQ